MLNSFLSQHLGTRKRILLQEKISTLSIFSHLNRTAMSTRSCVKIVVVTRNFGGRFVFVLAWEAYGASVLQAVMLDAPSNRTGQRGYWPSTTSLIQKHQDRSLSDVWPRLERKSGEGRRGLKSRITLLFEFCDMRSRTLQFSEL